MSNTNNTKRRGRSKPSGCHYEIQIFGLPDLPRMIRAAASGDSNATHLLRIANDFLCRTHHQGPDEKPLCLGCDQVFDFQPDFLISIVTAFDVRVDSRAIVNTICPSCAGKHGSGLAYFVAAEMKRCIMPDLQVWGAGGRA
jgi:hypothetical protein